MTTPDLFLGAEETVVGTGSPDGWGRGGRGEDRREGFPLLKAADRRERGEEGGQGVDARASLVADLDEGESEPAIPATHPAEDRGLVGLPAASTTGQQLRHLSGRQERVGVQFDKG